MTASELHASPVSAVRERAEPVARHVVAARAAGEVVTRSEEREQVGDGHEDDEGDAPRQRHRRTDDRREQCRRGNAEQRAAAQRAVHLVGAGRPYGVAQDSPGHFPLSGDGVPRLKGTLGIPGYGPVPT